MKRKLAIGWGMMLGMGASVALATESNLLVNPEFAHWQPNSGAAHYVAGWNTEEHGQIKALQTDQESQARIELEPGAKVWQFFALPDVELDWKQAPLSLAVEVAQQTPQALGVRLALLGVESAEGTWSPVDFPGVDDKRTFSKHGRGELIALAEVEARSSQKTGIEWVKAEGLVVDWEFTRQKESSAEFRNAVGIQVEFTNLSDQPIQLRNPVLVKSEKATTEYSEGRALPQWYRQIPRTIAKLQAGEPIYILTLGSSIDRGSANPRLYIYDENPQSPNYKQPLANDKPFNPELVQRPDLTGYLGWFQHYFMYTGRLRLELMRKYGYSVDGILLNVMACDGSSIGESHSGFADYAALKLDPAPGVNGHAAGKSWKELYPKHFAEGKHPVPDLVVFGHGHNERIDGKDEIAVFEGAIRWFQKHYPQVEFVNCMWIRTESDKLNESMPELCAHYGIPFIPVNELIRGLNQTSNYFALAPDGGHPQSAAHYLWFKQLEKAFEVGGELKEPLPQKHLPERMNPYSYLWEGEMIRFEQGNPRLVENRMMIVEDGPFNVWAAHDAKNENMQIAINGEIVKDSGRGRNSPSIDLRNSAFVYGRLAVGERHIFELIGENPRLVGVDNKVAPAKQFFPAGDAAWQTGAVAADWESAWGYPYGNKIYTLKAGETAKIALSAEVISVAWVDEENGGAFEAIVDGETVWSQQTNVPFMSQDGNSHYIENRRAIPLKDEARRELTIRALDGEVKILGVYGYSTTQD